MLSFLHFPGKFILPRRLLALVLITLPACPAPFAHAAAQTSISVSGTVLKVTLPDGRIVAGKELQGGILSISIAGEQVKARIASVETDPKDPTATTLLYDVRLKGADGSEKPLCNPDPDGRRLGFPLAGRTDATNGWQISDSFEFVCTAGAQGKCVRFGYKPWEESAGGPSKLDYYNACIRMVRADYCGDGVGHTRNGTLIGFGDQIGINSFPGDDVMPEGPPLRFEARWTAKGAACVARTRLPDLLTLEALVKSCPHLAGKTGPEACKPGDSSGLIDNFSR